jgi:hypothetical protein
MPSRAAIVENMGAIGQSAGKIERVGLWMTKITATYCFCFPPILSTVSAQILARDGRHEEALRVLDEAAAGFQRLDQAGGLTHVDELCATIRGQDQGA